MKANTINAWLLHKKPQGESSVYATFFTEPYGVISVNVKGGRGLKKHALLQAFNPLWIELCNKERFVNKIESNGPSLVLQGESLFAGLYVNELIYYFLRLHDAHANLYKQYEKTLNDLHNFTARHDLGITLRNFETSLLRECGYELNLTKDNLHQAIDSDKYYSFFPDEGFKLAPSGFKGEYILDFFNNNFNNPKVLPIAKIITRTAIDFALEGRNINARSLYKSGV